MSKVNFLVFGNFLYTCFVFMQFSKLMVGKGVRGCRLCIVMSKVVDGSWSTQYSLHQLSEISSSKQPCCEVWQEFCCCLVRVVGPHGAVYRCCPLLNKRGEPCASAIREFSSPKSSFFACRIGDHDCVQIQEAPDFFRFYVSLCDTIVVVQAVMFQATSMLLGMSPV